MIELSYSRIKTTAYVYITLPVMCFLLFYMNSLIGIGLSIVWIPSNLDSNIMTYDYESNVFSVLSSCKRR